MKNYSLSYYRILLITLISSTAITGIGFLDNKIWNWIFVGLGMLAYAIVGFLYSIKAIQGKQEGKDAYAVVFFVLFIIGIFVYNGIRRVQQWLVSWSFGVKASVIVLLVLSIIAVSIIMYLKNKKQKKEAN